MCSSGIMTVLKLMLIDRAGQDRAGQSQSHSAKSRLKMWRERERERWCGMV